jgi:hypothetical protein
MQIFWSPSPEKEGRREEEEGREGKGRGGGRREPILVLLPGNIIYKYFPTHAQIYNSTCPEIFYVSPEKISDVREQ